MKTDIFSLDWCDLIFEGKNRSYGAYELRKNSPRRHFYALLAACLLVIFSATLPGLIRQIIPKKKEIEVRVRSLTNINLEKPKENNILKELPPTPPPPVLRNTIRFTPPVIKPDEQVSEEDEPKMQKEVVETKAAIGATNYDKGTDDISAPIAVPEEHAKISEETEAPFVIVEQMPQFPGGEKEMMNFIRSHLKYPVLAQEMGVSGTVIINFVVDKTGSITNIIITRGIGSGCDEEAIRVVKLMPKWTPGRQGGRTVRVSYNLPFRFILK
jgi:protein TonB